VIQCELLFNARQLHVEQIHTGFVALHRRGFVRMKLTKLRRPIRWTGLLARINGHILVYYDLNDDARIFDDALNDVDFYFKRSFTEEHSKASSKIYPLGLNYPLFSDGFDWFRLRRELSVGSPLERIKGVTRQFFKPYPTSRHTEAAPDFDRPPKVLLLTKAWANRKKHRRNSQDSLEALDDYRAACIRALRKSLGDMFLGGMADEPAARDRFSDLIIKDRRVTAKKSYLRLLREFPICVTTKGLWDSNGWRLGEYVAQSKAIVTERPAYQAPGSFANGVNYLDFTTPEECVGAVQRLIDGKALRSRMMIANWRYYRAYIRADSLIMNSLAIALGGG
jgi:hypothetical protein